MGAQPYYTKEGKRVPSVTTIIGACVNKPALVPWAAWAAVIVAFTPDDPVTFRIYDKECLVELVRYWVTRRYASFGDVKTLVVEKEARLNEPQVPGAIG